MTVAEPLPVVMQVTPNLEIGGAQESLRTMAAYFPRAGWRSVVCTFEDGPLRTEIENLGVPVEVLPSRRYTVFAFPLFVAEMLRRRRDLLALVHEHGVSAVQTYGLGTLDFLVMTLRRRVQVWWRIGNVRFMVRAEHLGRHRWLLRPKRAVHRLLYRMGIRLVDGVIAVSDETERAFRASVGYTGDKVVVIANGADLERYPAPVDRDHVRARLGLRASDHVMTMVGTFKRQKGHRYLVDALREVAPRFPRLSVLLVGDGELASSVMSQVASAGLEDRIRFLGSRRDVPELLAASDSFVLPSLWEGLSVALVEAMASALPVIATDVSGTRQVMIDGETGWLVPPGDAQRLAAAIEDLLSEPARARRMAVAARARVAEHFSAHAQAKQFVALFEAGRSSSGDDRLRVAAQHAPAGLVSRRGRRRRGTEMVQT